MGHLLDAATKYKESWPSSGFDSQAQLALLDEYADTRRMLCEWQNEGREKVAALEAEVNNLGERLRAAELSTAFNATPLGDSESLKLLLRLHAIICSLIIVAVMWTVHEWWRDATVLLPLFDNATRHFEALPKIVLCILGLACAATFYRYLDIMPIQEHSFVPAEIYIYKVGVWITFLAVGFLFARLLAPFGELTNTGGIAGYIIALIMFLRRPSTTKQNP